MPKGSKTAVVRNGRATLLDARRGPSRKKYEAWKKVLLQEAIAAHAPRPFMAGPLAVTIEFFLPPPKHETRAMRARTWHTVRYDVDKLARTVFDALTGTIIIDDSCIAIARLEKRFARDDMPTGARISITTLPDGE